MALGDNRRKVTVNGQTLWKNPNTGKYFKSKKSTTPVPKPTISGATDTTGTSSGGNTSAGSGSTKTPSGKNRNSYNVGGTIYWYNPNTGKWFDSKNSSTPIADPTKNKGGGSGSGGGGTSGGDGTTPDPETPAEEVPGEETPEEEGRPPKPSSDPPDGYEWYWDEDTERWDYRKTGPQQKYENDLFAEYSRTLEEFGLTGLDEFLKQAVKEDWGESTFLIRLRREEAYLANPLFAANLRKAAKGGGFMSEGQVLAYANEAKRLAKQFGFEAPSDNYIASGLEGGKSLAEIEFGLQTQQKAMEYGPAVRMLYEEATGSNLTDQDLWEIFNPEIDTQQKSEALRDAMYQGRPFNLGFGVRSQREADALRMLGIDPDEANTRWQTVAKNNPMVSRFQAIEEMIAGKLPGDFGSFIGELDNSTILQAFLTPGTVQGAAAMARIQAMASREVARFTQQGGAASSQGQALGLLSGAEKASYG